MDTDYISALDSSHDVSNLQFVSFDVETTGLSPVVSRLVELSGVKFRLFDSQVETFSTLIDPESKIPPEVSAVHGITDDMVEGAPKCQEAIPQFLEWLGPHDTVLVAHNAPFDVSFMQIAIAKLRLKTPPNPVIDTLPLTRQLLPDSPNHQLKTIVEYLGLESGGFHRALADSHHVKHIIEHLAKSTEQPFKVWGDISQYGCVFPFDRDPYGFEPPANVQESIDSLKEAIAAGNSVRIVYSGFRSSTRVVEPVAVIQSRGNFYLTAYCPRVDAERTFRVDKIKEISTAGNSASRAALI